MIKKIIQKIQIYKENKNSVVLPFKEKNVENIPI